MKKQVKVSVHDPMAIENVRKKFKNKIKYTNSISDVLKDSSCGVIMTAWPEYSKITNRDIKNMKKRIIIDSQRILNNTKLDCVYNAIGIGN